MYPYLERTTLCTYKLRCSSYLCFYIPNCFAYGTWSNIPGPVISSLTIFDNRTIDDTDMAAQNSKSYESDAVLVMSQSVMKIRDE